MPTVRKAISKAPAIGVDGRAAPSPVDTATLQTAIANRANFSSIATDTNGIIRIFNAGAERMLGYPAAAVIGNITLADVADPHDVVARASALSLEFAVPVA